MEYSKKEQETIIAMCESLLEMNPQEMQYVYENSKGKILGLEIAYGMAKEILTLRKNLKENSTFSIE